MVKAKEIAAVLGFGCLIALYIGGLAASLFGPAWDRLLSISAFLGTILLLGITEACRRRGVLRGAEHYWPRTSRFARPLRVAMVTCVIIGVAAAIVSHAASYPYGGGVTDGRRPVFEEQTSYQLNNHGDKTMVSRLRYLVVGTSFQIAWASYGMAGALVGLYLALIGPSKHCVGKS